MSASENSQFFEDASKLISIINSIDAGIWEIDNETKNVRCSAGFYKVLGYEPGELEFSYQYFIDHLIYYEDRDGFLATLQDVHENAIKQCTIRLLTKSGYQWYQHSIQSYMESKLVGTLLNIHELKVLQLQKATESAFFNETNKLVKLGRWEIETATYKLFLSAEGSDVLALPSAITHPDQLIELFLPDYKTSVSSAIHSGIHISKPFELDGQVKTGTGKVIWVKMKAVVEIDKYGKCFLLKGVIQDINDIKQKENDLKSSLSQFSEHNKRLENFAHIVSHNLRSYVGNLQIMVNLHKETNSAEDKIELFGHIETISLSLGTMIGHLNEIVQINSNREDNCTVIDFELLFKGILSALQSNIKSADAAVVYDFSKCPEVKYVPAYLESIFHNLLSNAIKYRHSHRKAFIKCESWINNNDVYLIFEDNGVGIDLDKYGGKVFGMYQTFHRNADSQGIGLYITRNQVEALGGTINIESKVDVGTKFIIKLTRTDNKV